MSVDTSTSPEHVGLEECWVVFKVEGSGFQIFHGVLHNEEYAFPRFLSLSYLFCSPETGLFVVSFDDGAKHDDIKEEEMHKTLADAERELERQVYEEDHLSSIQHSHGIDTPPYTLTTCTLCVPSPW